MKVEKVIENDNGTCTVHFELSKEETEMLVEFALKRVIEEHVERLSNEKEKTTEEN